MKFDVRTRINEAGKREQIFSMQDCLYRVTLQEQGIARYRIFVEYNFSTILFERMFVGYLQHARKVVECLAGEWCVPGFKHGKIKKVK
jgi:hypothetical protein